MKAFFVVAALVASAFAQQATIFQPTADTSILPNAPMNVTVLQQGSNSEIHQVAIVIGLQPCISTAGCSGNDGVGSVLYNGPFNPQYSSDAPGLGLHQNFTLQVPQYSYSGPALLGLVHLELIGAVAAPFYEVSNVTVNLQ